MRATRHTYRKIKLDDLMAMLGGFEEATPYRPSWKEDRARFESMWREGLSLKVIAMRLGRTVNAVRTMRCIFGLPSRHIRTDLRRAA